MSSKKMWEQKKISRKLSAQRGKPVKGKTLGKIKKKLSRGKQCRRGKVEADKARAVCMSPLNIYSEY